MTGDDWAAVLVAVALCAVGGLLVPTLIRSVPEPEPEPEPEDGAEPTEAPDVEPKVPYAEVAAAPGLAWKSAAASAVAGAVVGWSVGWDWPLLFLLPLVPVGVALSVVDWRTRFLPTHLIRPAFAVTALLILVCWAITQDIDAVVRALIAMVVIRSLFWILWWVHAAGMGFGDVRLSAVLGLALGYLGWGELVVGSYAGFLVFAVPGVLFALVRWDRKLLKTAYPFGPFMLVGALIGIAVGADVWAHLVPA